MERHERVQVLKSGKFSIYFHDNEDNAWAVYDTFIPEHMEDWEEFDKRHKLFEADGWGAKGYATEIVVLLVEALGGKVESI